MKYQDLDRKDKIEYILDYYKIHIIAGILLLILIYNILNTLVFNPEKKVSLDIVVRGGNFDFIEMEADVLKDELATLIELDSKKEQVSIENLPIREYSNPSFRMAYESKFMAKASNDDLDIIIIDETYIPVAKENEILMPIEIVDDLDKQDLYFGDKLVGINIKRFDKLSRLINFDVASGHEYYVCVFADTKNLDNVNSLLGLDFK